MAIGNVAFLPTTQTYGTLNVSSKRKDHVVKLFAALKWCLVVHELHVRFNVYSYVVCLETISWLVLYVV